MLGTSINDLLDRRLEALRSHVGEIASSVPRLPSDLADAIARLDADSGAAGLITTSLLFALAVMVGLAADSLVKWALRGEPSRFAAQAPVDVGRSPRALIQGAAIAVARLAAFAAASMGAVVAVGLSPVQRQVAVLYLVAAATVRGCVLILRFVLSPRSAALRIVPMADDRADLWRRYGLAGVVWFAAGYATVAAFGRLGLPMPSRLFIAYLFATGLLATVLRLVWSLRRVRVQTGQVIPPAALATGFVALWLLWLMDAIPLFWSLAVVLALPPLIRTSRSVVRNMLTASDERADGHNVATAVLIERALRAALLAAGAMMIGWAWKLDWNAVMSQDSTLSRLLAGAISASIILLTADLLWQLAKTSIDEKIRRADALATAAASSLEASRRQARLRTLLPILRNLLGILMLTMAALMALSALGVQIGPLLAGAGVVGVAIGFGSQTVVRDIIAGAFYLLDDAFRVGEYIQSGAYKGTVESFSLRSVRLRHHRGALYTVPFGTLGAVQNMSRDWVIDKIMVAITYDSDLAAVKRVVKQVSREMSVDPELGRMIIEPLKSQGIAAFADSGIQVRLKVKTLPGDQFVVRRAVFERIKTAFDAAGIRFAVPTVAVTGQAEGHAAAAAQVALASAATVAAGP